MHMPPWWVEIETTVKVLIFSAIGWMGKQAWSDRKAAREARSQAAITCAAEDRKVLNELAEAKALLASVQRDLTELTDEVKRLKSKLVLTLDEVEELKGDRAALAAEKKILSNQLTRAETEIAELRATLVTRDARIDDLENQVAQLQAELKVLTLGGES